MKSFHLVSRRAIIVALALTATGGLSVAAQSRGARKPLSVTGAGRPLSGVSSPLPFTWFQGGEGDPLGVATGVAFDSQGKPIAVGSLTQDGRDVFAVRKFHRDGTVAWTRTFSGTGLGVDQAAAVVVDDADAVIAVGFVTNESDTGCAKPNRTSSAPRAPSSRDWAAMKVQSDGTVDWQYAIDFDDGLDDELTEVTLDSAGSILVSGSIGTFSGGQDFTLAKLEPNSGTTIWVTSLDGGEFGADFAAGVAVGPSLSMGGADSVYGVGMMTVAGDGQPAGPAVRRGLGGSNPAPREPTGSGVPSLTAVRLDGDTGVVAWQYHENRLEQETSEQGKDIVVDPSGDAFVAGTVASGADAQFYVARLAAADGARLWFSSGIGSIADSRNCAAVLALDPTLGLFVGGNLANTDTGSDAVVKRYDPGTGDLIWWDLSIGPGEDFTDGIAVAGGKVVVAQSSSEFSSVERFQVMILDANGQRQTAFQGAPSSTNAGEAFSVAVRPNGDIIAGGLTLSGAEDIDFSVGFVDCTPPTLRDCLPLPGTLKSTGGGLDLGVTVSDEFGLGLVAAEITLPMEAGIVTAVLAEVTPGIFTYPTGPFPIPPNDELTPQTYGVRYIAHDSTGNVGFLDCGAVMIAGKDVTPPTVNRCDVLTTRFPSTGGRAMLVINAIDNEEIVLVKGFVIPPDFPPHPYSLVPAATVNDFEAFLDFPANGTPLPQTYAVTFEVQDARGNRTTGSCQSVVVEAADLEAPVIVSCSVTPSSLPQPGGAVVVTATVTDNIGVAAVNAEASDGMKGTAMVSLGAIGGDQFQGTLNLPANGNALPLDWSISVTAADAAPNPVTAQCGVVRVAGTDGSGPTITNCVVNPTSLPSVGGNVTIRADVTDSSSVSSVVAKITGPLGTETVSMVPKGTKGGGPEYSFTQPIPPNSGAKPAVYQIEICARDAADNESRVACDSVQVAAIDKEPPTLTLPVTNPTELPSEGGTVNFQVCVFDNVGVASAHVIIGAPSGPLGIIGGLDTVIELKRIGIDLYGGSYVAPPNLGPSPLSYPVRFEAEDLSGNGAGIQGAAFTVAAPAKGSGRLKVSRRILDFGLVLLKQTRRMTVSARNNGDAPLSFQIEQPGSFFTVMRKEGRAVRPLGPYSYYTLKPGERAEFAVDFQPLEHGRFKASLNFLPLMSDGPARPPKKALATVELRGLGCRRIR